jgi:hypothetical protein
MSSDRFNKHYVSSVCLWAAGGTFFISVLASSESFNTVDLTNYTQYLATSFGHHPFWELFINLFDINDVRQLVIFSGITSWITICLSALLHRISLTFYLLPLFSYLMSGLIFVGIRSTLSYSISLLAVLLVFRNQNSFLLSLASLKRLSIVICLMILSLAIHFSAILFVPFLLYFVFRDYRADILDYRVKLLHFREMLNPMFLLLFLAIALFVFASHSTPYFADFLPPEYRKYTSLSQAKYIVTPTSYLLVLYSVPSILVARLLYRLNRLPIILIITISLFVSSRLIFSGILGFDRIFQPFVLLMFQLTALFFQPDYLLRIVFQGVINSQIAAYTIYVLLFLSLSLKIFFFTQGMSL